MKEPGGRPAHNKHCLWSIFFSFLIARLDGPCTVRRQVLCTLEHASVTVVETIEGCEERGPEGANYGRGCSALCNHDHKAPSLPGTPSQICPSPHAGSCAVAAWPVLASEPAHRVCLRRRPIQRLAISIPPFIAHVFASPCAHRHISA